VIYIIKR